MGWTTGELVEELGRFRAHEFKVPKSDPDKAFTAWMASEIAKQGKGLGGATRARQMGTSPNSSVYAHIFRKATEGE